MAILWMDGFDHYGLDEDNMLDGVYASIYQPTLYNYLSTTKSRTGTHSFKLSGQGAFGNDPSLRRVLGGTYDVVGVGGAYFFDSLPDSSTRFRLEFRDNANEIQYSVFLSSTGQLVGRIDADGEVDGTSEQVITSNAWHHIEVRLDCDLTSGAVEVRVNGVTVLNLTGINTAGTGVAGVGQVSWAAGAAAGGDPAYIDDIYAWAPTGEIGDTNNDFIGDRRVVTLYPDADTSVAGLLTSDSSLNGYDMINEVDPDDDASFLEAEALTDSNPIASEFDLSALPLNVAVVTAVQTYVRMKKTEAGVGNVQASVMVDSDESPGADRPVTEEWTYWMDTHDLSPASGAPFTAAEINRMQLRLARTE